MVQGNKKLGGRPGAKKSAPSKNQGKLVRATTKKLSKTKKGNPNVHGNKLRQVSGQSQYEEAELSRAIGKASEEKTAAKLLQSGGGLTTAKDLHQKGKEIIRTKRRDQVKKKVGRTEQKMLDLKAAVDVRDM